MGSIWLPQWERVDLAGQPRGNPYRDTDNIKLLWHTWEGRNWDSAESAFAPYPPHVAANFTDKRVRQYVPLDEHAYALAGSASEAEFVIQVELAGFAHESRDMSQEEKDWIAHAVLEPILFFHDVPDIHPPFYDDQDGITLASKNSPIRFALSDWVVYSGHVGHQHAPNPDEHWDPGRLDVDTIIQIARQGGQNVLQQEAEMAYAVDSKGRFWTAGRGLDDAAWVSFYDKAWTGPFPIGGKFIGPISIVAWPNIDRVDVGGIGTDNKAYRRWCVNGTWSPKWEPDSAGKYH